jgi:DNA-binding response OmpR family regulator
LNDIILNKLKDYTLLFVENEKGIRDNYRDLFNLLFKEVNVACDGEDALTIFKTKNFDLIITDIKMPKMDGIELIKNIRKVNTSISIIIISAHTNVELLLSSIPLNLISYIVKPINEEKLFEAFENFINNKSEDTTFTFEYDKEKSQISFFDKTYDLSLKESRLIHKLRGSKRIISYEEIENELWQDNSMSQNALRLFMKNLRKKLPKKTIKNIPNQGYILQ